MRWPLGLASLLATGLAAALPVSWLFAMLGSLLTIVLTWPEERLIYAIYKEKALAATLFPLKVLRNRVRVVLATMAVICIGCMTAYGYCLVSIASSLEEISLKVLPTVGADLTSEEAADLERRLESDPDDIKARAQLLGYYKTAGFKSSEAREAHLRHILWVIEHRPESSLAGDPYATVRQKSQPEAYAQAKALWLTQVDAHPRDARVAWNAAQFFRFGGDPVLEEEYGRKARALDFNNPEYIPVAEQYRGKARLMRSQ